MTTTTYQRQYHSFDEEDKFSVDGEVVHVAATPKGLSHGAEVLVELSEEDEKLSVEDDQKDQEKHSGTEEKHRFFCNEELESGNRCSREVDLPDEKCWQHRD